MSNISRSSDFHLPRIGGGGQKSNDHSKLDYSPFKQSMRFVEPLSPQPTGKQIITDYIDTTNASYHN